jgi:hypothetical protein
MWFVQFTSVIKVSIFLVIYLPLVNLLFIWRFVMLYMLSMVCTSLFFISMSVSKCKFKGWCELPCVQGVIDETHITITKSLASFAHN